MMYTYSDTTRQGSYRLAVSRGRAGLRGNVWRTADFGATWQKTKLQQPPNRYSWQTWSAELKFPSQGYYEIWSRATDDRGVAQPFVVQWNPHGYHGNAMHRIAVTVA